MNRQQTNKELCDKYPFLTWFGDPLFKGYIDEKCDYSYTWEDELPEGWRKAFCPQIWEELKSILEKANYVDKFNFEQIKEKWGYLHLYYSGVPECIYDEVRAWETKYEELSEQVCINCGKPADCISKGWISYLCKDCAKELNLTTESITKI